MEQIERQYNRVIAAACEKPWAILPAKLALLAEVLALRISGQRFTDEELVERLGAKPNRATTPTGSVAVIQVFGSIIPRGASFNDVSMGQATSMEQFIGQVNAAANDGNVSQILLDIDSPGGQTDMLPEAAAALRNARAKKPVVAVANTMAASAAYWLASQASELVVTPSGEVGSIGVFAVHSDLSEQFKMLGVNPTIIKAGKYKAELSPLYPLTDEGREYVQSQVDTFYSMFTKDVAMGRGVPVSNVRNGFGEGRMVIAGDAVKAGMADRVDTFDNTLARMMRGQLSQGSQAIESGSAMGTGWLDVQPVQVEITDESQAFHEWFIENQPLVVTDGTTTTTVTGQTYFTITSDGAEVITIHTSGDEASVEEALDPKPQDALAELRQKSRQAAISERETYLSLLRRMR